MLLQTAMPSSHRKRLATLGSGSRHVSFRLLVFLLTLWTGMALAAQALPPAPTQWVTDTQNRLTGKAVLNLNNRLKAYQEKTGHHVLVWIGATTGGMPIDDWAVRTFESWKVGRAGIDDGLVLFILTQDRKLRIEVGYGLEGQMPDAKASRIIREVLVPPLDAGQWDGALTQGIDRILETLGGDEGAKDRSSHRRGQRPSEPTLSTGQIVVLVLVGILFLILLITNPGLAIGLLFSILSRGGGRGGDGGGWSGGGGRSGGGGASGSW